MEKENAARELWPVPAAQATALAEVHWSGRSAEFVFASRANSPLRIHKWQQVLKVQVSDITVRGFHIQQRGEQQCSYWQIPNTRAR